MGMGRLAYDKAYDDLLRGFALYLENNHAKLMLIGDGPERDALENTRANNSALPNMFGLVVLCQTLTRTSPAHRYLCIAAVANLLAMSFLEALALGRPILIQEAAGGMQEIIEGGHGAIVPRREPEAMAQAIGAAITHPPDPEKQVARAQVFSVERATQSMLGLLHE